MKNLLTIFFVCTLAAFGIYSCNETKDDPLLERLDATLEMKETYQGYFKERIAVLNDVLAEQNDPDQIYNIRKRLALAYKPNSFDSTLNILLANRALAISEGNLLKQAETDFMLVEAYTKAGYHFEASEILGGYSAESVPEEMLRAYYSVAHCF